MSRPDHVSQEALEWAEVFCDAHRGVEDDRELLALAFMDLQQRLPQPAGLTERQADALKFISAYHAANGFAPTYREIAQRFDNSTSRAHELVTALVDRGYLVRLPGRARSLALASIGHVSSVRKISEEA